MAKAKVLIVEDNPQVSSMIRRIAERMNLEVLAAQGVYSAISMMNQADILLLDLHLPNGEPTIIIERWQARDAGRPMAIISAYIDDDVETDMFQRGAWNVLRKPVPITTIERVLLNYRSHIRWVKTAVDIEQRIVRLEVKYKKLVKLFAVLAILSAAVLGEKFLPLLLKLFF